MHEMSVTQSIVEACSERASGAQVLRVTLQIGTLSCVMPESLRFCFEVARVDTPLADAELVIERIVGHSRCNECGDEVEMLDVLTLCPCGSGNLQRPEGGNELKIRSMEIEEAA